MPLAVLEHADHRVVCQSIPDGVVMGRRSIVAPGSASSQANPHPSLPVQLDLSYHSLELHRFRLKGVAIIPPDPVFSSYPQIMVGIPSNPVWEFSIDQAILLAVPVQAQSVVAHQDITTKPEMTIAVLGDPPAVIGLVATDLAILGQ